MVLTDTNYKPLPVQPQFTWTDTSFTRITLRYPWQPNTFLKLLIAKEAATDSSGTNIYKADTLEVNPKKESAYGSIRLHFTNLDFAKNPILQLVQSDKVVDSIPIKQKDWFRKLYQPGDYELRILYDRNQNGTWSPGLFWQSAKKEQPELVLPAKPAKITIRPNWDNEWDVVPGDPIEGPEPPGGRKPGSVKPSLKFNGRN
jgi:hypothetical protein